jgi:hypothetical protein
MLFQHADRGRILLVAPLWVDGSIQFCLLCLDISHLMHHVFSALPHPERRHLASSCLPLARCCPVIDRCHGRRLSLLAELLLEYIGQGRLPNNLQVVLDALCGFVDVQNAA